ncbi:hypothetical protein HDV62DRAFT_20952 [Trichoderma sp. SZMC 28011]
MSLLNAPLQSYFHSFVEHTYELLSPIISHSKIPVFIKDIDHPWINENLQWLENRDDPFKELCDPSSEIYRGIDGRVCPDDLFNRLVIDNNKWGMDRTPWRNARDRLREMRDCPMALDSVKHLYVDIYVSSGEYGFRYDSPNPGDEIPELFADVLTLMHNLERIDWKLSEQSANYFESVFSKRNLSLPSVNHLVPSQSSIYLIPMCSNLQVLEATGSRSTQESFIESTSKVPSIRSLKFDAGREWSEPLLSDLLRAMPNLVSLSLKGRIGTGTTYSDLTGMYSAERFHYVEIEEEKLQMVKNNLGLEPDDIIIIKRPNDPYLKTFLRELASYPNIKHLKLPYSADLSLGFDGGPWCGNAYFGPDGRAYHRRVLQEGAETNEKAARIALSVLPHLESISIGGSTPNMTKEDGNKVVFEWPWTGRMEEWLLEQVPDVAKDDPWYDPQ